MSDALILCYHAVSSSWPADLSITPEAFERQLSDLARRGYQGRTATEAMKGGTGDRVVAVTFDDAYRSVLEVAKPILDSLGWPASVYVPSNWAGREDPMTWPGIDQWLGGPHEQELLCMTWDELRGLDDAGWEVGSHTRSHPRLPELDDAALDDELAGSKADCEQHLGRPCTSLAYPYGAVDERVVEAAGRAGYDHALTLPRAIHPPRPLFWPRVGIYQVDGQHTWRWRMKVSPAIRRVRGSGAWGVVDRTRRRLLGIEP